MLHLLHSDMLGFGRGVALLVICLTSYWIIPFLHGLTISSTRNVPGPLLARFTRWYEYFAVLRGKSNIEYMQLHDKFGMSIVSPTAQ